MRHLLVVISILIACTSFAQTKISNDQALKKIKKKGIQLLDVRTENEYDQNHIPNAININWNKQDQFAEIANKLNKKKPIYLYCKSGNRSAKAAKYLTEQGFRVFDIEGGVIDWQKSNLPLVTTEEELTNLNLKKLRSLIKYHPKVLVDFYADWCVPCQEMAPIIADVASQHKDTMKVLKINTDLNKTLVKQMGISGIPQISIYQFGKETWTATGLTDKETLQKAIN